MSILFNDGIAPASLPSDAVGIWDAQTGYVASPRKLIKNSAPQSSSLDDANLLALPRGNFLGTGSNYYAPYNLTVTDNNSVAPDGSTEASTLVTVSSGLWQLEAALPTLPIGTYSLCISVRSLSGSNQSFKLRAGNSNEGEATFTATPSWQRFKFTFTMSSAITSAQGIHFPSGTINIAVCDFELFAGSADQHSLYYKPPSVANGDILLGDNHYVSSASVSGGFTSNTTRGYLTLPVSKTFSTFTFVFGVDPTSEPSLAGMHIILSKIQAWYELGVGPTINTTTGPASLIWNGNGSLVRNVNAAPVGGASWARNAGGFATFIVRYDGVNITTFVNDIKVQEGLATLSPMAARDFLVGSYGRSDTSGYRIGLMAIYDRAFTNDEVHSAHAYLIGKFSDTPSKKIIGVGADSISSGGTSWVERMGYDLNPRRHVINEGLFSQTIAMAVTTQFPYLDTRLVEGPVQDEYLFILALHSNDLLQDGKTPTQTIKLMEDAIDERRRMGWTKFMATTILPRAGGGSVYTTDALFDAARATVNTAIRNKLGGRLDGIIDFAADPTMGPNGANHNPTYYDGGDFTHPTAAGQIILAGIAAPAINNLGVVVTTKTLTADPGSYTLTGTAATLAKSSIKILVADPGSYALTGTAATLKVARKVVAGTSSYTLTGTAANLTKTAFKTLAAGASSYTLTGATTTVLRLGRKAVAAPGSYTLTGSAATLRWAHKVVAAPGSYALTGTAATLKVARKLLATTPGSYTLTGSSANLLKAGQKALSADAGSYALTPATTATLRWTHKIVGASSSYALTGTAATLVRVKTLAAAAGSYTLTGQPATLKWTHKLVASPGSYALTGYDAVLLKTGSQGLFASLYVDPDTFFGATVVLYPPELYDGFTMYVPPELRAMATSVEHQAMAVSVELRTMRLSRRE